jgi:hypothetical protein
MLPKFAYSFDRESFTGSFDSRSAALAAALAHAAQLSDGLSTIYVAMRVDADPQAGGHAESVLKCMARRAHQHDGDSSQGYLKRVNDQQEAELDDALRNVIEAWLKKHELGPTFFQIKSVSEHQIPTSKQVQCGSSDEVHEIGVSEYPLG